MKKERMSKKYKALVLYALDLQASIKNAYWAGKLQAPTTHMREASDNLDYWLDGAGIPRAYYGKDTVL